jgi:hypothetical protein
MQNITEDFLEVFLSQFPDHPDPAGEISELPELGAVETSEPAQIKDFSITGRSKTGPVREIDQARYNFLMAERTRLLQIIRSRPVTREPAIEYSELFDISIELDEIIGRSY